MAALSFRCALDVGPPLSSFISSMELMAVCHAGGAPVSTMKSMAIASGMKTVRERFGDFEESCNGIGMNRRTRKMNEIFYFAATDEL
jgi:hypothetical protein